MHAIPWFSPTGRTRAGLPDHHSLYRTTADALATIAPEKAVAVDGWLEACAAFPEYKSRWKGAAFSWMAGWWPDAGSVRFFEEALKNDDVRRVLRESERTDPWWNALRPFAA